MKNFRISLYKEPQGFLSTEDLDNLRAKVAETQYEITEENIEELVGEGIAKQGSFDSLTDEQVEKFSKEYEIPELFVKINEEIFALPLTPGEAEKWRRAYENQG